MAQSGSNVIVLGYDASSHADRALEWATLEAARQGSLLQVLTAAVPTGVAFPDGAAEVMSPSALDVARTTAEGGVARVRQLLAEVSAEATPVADTPAAALVEASANAGLVVVGTRGHGEFVGALLGSVAFSVTAHAHCPVVVVHADSAPPGPGRPVFVGFDGSPMSFEALTYGAASARAHEAELFVVSAWQPQAAALTSYAVADYAPDRAQYAAEALLDDAAAQVAKTHPRLHVYRETPEGPPGKTLADYSRRAGLLVIGARGHGGFAGLNLGSVSHTLIHRAACPVVVVRRPDRSG